MNEVSRFVDCPAIRKSLEDNFHGVYNVVKVWEGSMRNDNTIKVYVEITDTDDEPPIMFTENALADLKAICGELRDIEIKDACTLEFGFALPLTSPYYND